MGVHLARQISLVVIPTMSTMQLELGPNNLDNALYNIVAKQLLASIASFEAPISNVGSSFVRNNLIRPLPHEW